MSPALSPNFKSSFRKKLLLWYKKHRRDLPWRRTQDPYRIWVSEIMLQQTQVSTVIPYYENFLKKFPTLQKLARAPEEAVLAQWAGLGYYRRAKLLHQGARFILRELGGRFPENPESLKKLPSIGEYTAGAIASIAFHQAAPLVDGNVIRVYSRIFAKRGHAKETQLKKQIWDLAGILVAPENPGDFNQALMELGAMVCRPNLPACGRCPVSSLCRAYEQGNPQVYPETPPAGKIIKLKRVAAVCERAGKVLFVKPKRARWFQGMWSLPHDYWEGNAAPEEVLKRFLREDLGIRLSRPQNLGSTHHGITHHRITTLAWRGQTSGRPRKGQHYEITKYFPIQALNKLALPSFDRKVLQAGKLL